MSRSVFFATALSGLVLSAAVMPATVMPAQALKAKLTPHPGQDTFNPDHRDVSSAELLDSLFGRLHQARNEAEARTIEQAIWKLWRRSGSPSADLLLVQALKAINARAFPTALAILDTVINIKPDFAEAWNERATTYFLMRRFDESLADINRVLQLEPRHFGALAGRGTILRELGKKREALKAYRRALSIYPDMVGPKKAVKDLSAEIEQDI